MGMAQMGGWLSFNVWVEGGYDVGIKFDGWLNVVSLLYEQLH